MACVDGNSEADEPGQVSQSTVEYLVRAKMAFCLAMWLGSVAECLCKVT
jgi:hypothetical protein